MQADALEVVQAVHHDEPAAEIPEDEAAAVVAEQEASWIQHNVDSVGWGSDEAVWAEDVADPVERLHRVVLLRFSRSPP